MKKIRIGYGYDVHRLEDGLPMRIGGIDLEYSKGIVAHSDGDVLIHAICDAMLGASALGDIGKHFPDTSDQFKGINSCELLCRCVEMIRGIGYEVGNIDCMLTLEKPKIAPYVDLMREKLSEIVGVGVEDISIKATTKEKLGFVGREEGVEASAVLLLFPSEQ